MEMAASGRKPRAGYLRAKLSGAPVILLVLFLSMVTAGSGRAGGMGQNQADMEAMLQKAHADITQDRPEPGKLKQAIALLEQEKARFPQESRFPLYLAEAYYRLADPEADIALEYGRYEKTGAYAAEALTLNPGGAEAHYWHGLFLLRKAQQQGGIRAYFTVRQGIAELEKVRRELPSYDEAGPSRVLGLLHCLAPGWTPFGNLNKSIELEKEAVRLAPDYALNRLYLANAYAKRGDREAAIREYQTIIAASADKPEKTAREFAEQARVKLRELGV